MKKLVYALSFVALISVAGKAQDSKQDPKKDHATTTPAPKAEEHSTEPKSRMAITQKGVPASKSKENKDPKATEPKGQPGTEKH